MKENNSKPRLVLDYESAGYRTIAINYLGHHVTIICGGRLRRLSVKAAHKRTLLEPFHPNIRLKDGELDMSFPGMTVHVQDYNAFETAYQEAKQFCAQARPVLLQLADRIMRCEDIGDLVEPEKCDPIPEKEQKQFNELLHEIIRSETGLDPAAMPLTGCETMQKQNAQKEGRI